jgi:hypothetical protein
MHEGSFDMSISSERDPTKYFTVVGAAYVQERHDDRRYVEQMETSGRAGGVAGLWLVLYAGVIGFSVIANSNVAKWINVASLMP